MKHDIKQAEKVQANVDVVNAEDDQPAALYKLDEVPIYAILQPGQGNALEGTRRSCSGNSFRNLYWSSGSNPSFIGDLRRDGSFRNAYAEIDAMMKATQDRCHVFSMLNLNVMSHSAIRCRILTFSGLQY